MSTVRAALAAATDLLAAVDSARFEAELLLAHALARPRAWLYAHGEEALDDDAATTFAMLVQRRVAGEPVAYLTGRRAFRSLDLAVTPQVLIPREDTERLVELALAQLPPGPCDVADLGTGSGAIALAIAHERPDARIVATDASAPALAVARANALRLGLANVAFAQGDWCAALGAERFDLIAANPPYVAAGDAHLAQGDPRHEPETALVSGPDGLDAIRAIVASAPAHLKAGGRLLLEHGHDQGGRVRELLENRGFVAVATAHDAGGRERVSHGHWPSLP
jgi:release factor glutamine methyltransferase